MSQMQKSIISTTGCINKQFWFVLFACFLLWALLLCSVYTAFLTDNKGFFFFANHANSSSSNSPINPETTKRNVTNQPPPPAFNPVVDSCSGKYIYVHNELPTRFNEEILKDCSSLLKWFDMCQSISNMGFGPKAGNSHGILQNKSWFATNQFSLEIIFHNRMKKYKCLTNDSSLASAIYVPFYAGLDVGRHLWGFNTSVRDSTSLDLVNWLSQKPEWKKMWGRDHFLVSGRVAWDFNRQTQNDSDWGNNLLTLPETKNMTVLIIESSPWIDNNFAIPYPTSFHPTTENEVFQWQNKVRTSKRKYLFSFVGAPRPSLQGSIRGEIITQCLASKKCTLLDCNSHANKCDQPFQVIKMFRSSTFCLQPSGDSSTRRSIFDSILAGCIPVFFHPASAYKQYLWYLPKDYTKYSVFIPENEIKDGKVKIEEVLRKVSKEQVVGMREEVVRLIPKVVYRNSMTGLETSLEDAFDIAVKGVLDRVEMIRKEMLMKE